MEFIRLSLYVTYRHFVVYKKNFVVNVSPILLDPIFFMFTLGIGLGAYVDKIEGMDYISFVAPGLAISAALYTAFFESTYNFFTRLKFEKIYKSMLTTAIGKNEIIAGELIWVTTKGVFMSTSITILLLIFNIFEFNGYIIIVIPLSAFVALICGNIGMIATSYLKDMNQFQAIFAFLIQPMFFFSGIFYPTNDLPSFMSFLINTSPLYHGVALMQKTLWATLSLQNVMFHGSILILMSIISTIIVFKKVVIK